MKALHLRGLVLTIAALSVLAVAAVPAHASVTPVNANISGVSTDSNLTDEGTGLRTRCPRSDFVGRTSADGRRVSGTLTFSGDGRTTCTENVFGSSVTVVCRGNVTLTSRSSVAGVSASGDVSLDSDFECTIRAAIGAARSIRGPQTPTNCTWTFTQSTQLLTVRCATILTDSGGESGFAGSYRVTPRLVVS